MSGLRALIDPRLAGELGIAGRFLHRCTITRAQGRSAYQDPGEPLPHLADQPCYYAEETALEELEDGTRRTVTRELLLLPYGTDVTEGDIVTSVVDQWSVVRITRARDIESVVRHATHVACTLSGVR